MWNPGPWPLIIVSRRAPGQWPGTEPNIRSKVNLLSIAPFTVLREIRQKKLGSKGQIIKADLI
jgi:hypothetical protein